MGHSQAEKAKSRERILRQAAEQIREAGLESVSVGPLMRSVNLTHGGFYGHFASRADLLAQALEQALDDGEAAAEAARAGAGTDRYAATVRSYLSRAHRDARKSGCAVAALASDVARADEGARQTMSVHVERLVADLSRSLGGRDDEQAMFAAAAMVGGLLLSRVLADPERSDAMLRAVRAGLLALREDEDPAPPRG